FATLTVPLLSKSRVASFVPAPLALQKAPIARTVFPLPLIVPPDQLNEPASVTSPLPVIPAPSVRVSNCRDSVTLNGTVPLLIVSVASESLYCLLVSIQYSEVVLRYFPELTLKTMGNSPKFSQIYAPRKLTVGVRTAADVRMIPPGTICRTLYVPSASPVKEK